MVPRHLSSPLRHSLRQFHRPIHTTPPRRAPAIDWKGPLRTLGIRKPFSLGAGALSLAFFLTFPFWFKQPLPANYNQRQNDDLPAPVRGTQTPKAQAAAPPSNSVDLTSTVDEPVAKETDNFPEILEIEGIPEPFHLVAWGVRTVSFLRIQVYNVGLYIPESQYAVLPTYALSDGDTNPFPAMTGMYTCPLLLRIIPVRNTDYVHLRDGFVKSAVQRLPEYDAVDDRRRRMAVSIGKFKGLFPKSKMKKGEVLSVLKWGPDLHLYTGDGMKGHLGQVTDDAFAQALMGAYLVGDDVVSSNLLNNLEKKLFEIAAEANPEAEKEAK
jgi:Chalcone isomerase like